MKRLGVAPSTILTSPLPRADQTAVILAEVLGLTDRLERRDQLRAGQSAGSIRDWLASLGDEAPLIVGHNPAFDDLLAILVGSDATWSPFVMKKAGAAAFAVEEGVYRLRWFAPPALLRPLRD